MSLFMGVDKLSFLDKYTEEKEINGQTYTKLKHKADLSCVLLDIGNECYFILTSKHNEGQSQEKGNEYLH